MPAGGFILDFFCGPCLDNQDANEAEHDQRHQQRRSYDGSYDRNIHNNNGLHAKRSHHPNYPQSRHVKGFLPSGSSRRMAVPPTIHEMEERQPPITNEGQKKLHSIDNVPGGHNRGHGNRDVLQKFSSSRQYKRRDDSSVMAASLSETYQGYLGDPDDDEGSDTKADGRSRRKSRKSHGQRTRKGRNSSDKDYQSEPEPESVSSRKSKLEAFIEGETRSHSQPPRSTRSGIRKGKNRKSEPDEDFDNVTTISKASINPYHLLGISTSAGAMEIYDSYKRKRREFHPSSERGSEKAFRDVDNAYRRLKAELRRKEARMEQKRLERLNSERSRDTGKHSSKRTEKLRTRSKKINRQSESSGSDSDSDGRRSQISTRLRDHRSLVHDLFASDAKDRKHNSDNASVCSQRSTSVSVSGHVTSLQSAINSQMCALSAMNLVPIEAGSTNVNEQNKVIQNSCFYLSLAASYLSGSGAFNADPTEGYFRNATTNGEGGNGTNATAKSIEMSILMLRDEEMKVTQKLALQLKRAIEAAVVLVHPDWASTGAVGEEIQAFSDFLVYALDSDSVLGHWAVAVFDEASGFVDVYRGRHYGKIYPPIKVKRRSGESGKRRMKWKYKDCDEATKRATTLTLRYIPGHYQPLLPELTKIAEKRLDKNGRRSRSIKLDTRPSLEDILSALEKWKVLYVVTDGRA